MSDGRVAFLFGVHNHQPAGNFEDVMADAARRAYHPFLELLRVFPAVRLAVHCTGTLLEFLRERAPRTFDLLGALAARGQIELLTGGFYEPILPILPDHDKVGQIQYLTEFLKSHFGVRPRGMWLAERVWEPHLPRALAEAGVEFVLLDDRHFALAGLEPAELHGYYVTEEQGAQVAVFPISERLRYLVPFAEPAATLDHLRAWQGRRTGLTLVDDGEKFGLWPGTHQHVFADGWLARFFEALAGADWLEMSTFADFLESHPPTGRVYLPTASYTEMGHWALPTPAGLALEDAGRRLREVPGGEPLARWLRGGFWRTFLVKYPEVGETYWKMLRLSRAVQAGLAARPESARLREAQLALWRGQANDAYWHGVFGGCYLPHLRRAVKSALLDAERLEREAAGRSGVRCAREDVDGDGRAEVLLQSDALSVTLHPGLGGALTEIGFFPRALDVADVLSRRPEAYHGQVREAAAGAEGVRTIHAARASKEAGLEALLSYDRFRRASALDGLFPPGVRPDPVEPWGGASLALGSASMTARVETQPEAVMVTMSPDITASWTGSLEKHVRLSHAGLEVGYRVRWSGDAALAAQWGVQWNLALTAGNAPGRYFRLPGSPGLGSRGAVEDLTGLALVDEWCGVEVCLGWSRPAHVGWGPVETVSVSEDGFERLYQGTALLVTWPLALAQGEEWAERISLTLAAIPARPAPPAEPRS